MRLVEWEKAMSSNLLLPLQSVIVTMVPSFFNGPEQEVESED